MSSEEKTLEFNDIFVMGVRGEYEFLKAYVDIWKKNPEIWEPMGFSRPVNKILVICDPLMLFDHAVKKVAKEYNLAFVSGSPAYVLNSYPTLEVTKQKTLVFTDYPRSREDIKALLSLVGFAEKNMNLFLISLAEPDISKDVIVMFDDTMVIPPPGVSERKEIISRLLRPFIQTKRIFPDKFDYLVMITDGFKTYELVTFVKRIIAKSLYDNREVTQELIDSVYSQYLSGSPRITIESFDGDLLEQLYQMAVDENEQGVFELIKKLNDELPLSLTDQQLLARYPFLLIGSRKDRLALFFRARSIVRRLKGRQGGE